MEFLFVSKNVKRYLGYTDKDILREGVDISYSLIHPDDVSRTLEIHKNLFDLYFSVPAAERLTYKYCNEMRFKNSDGKYIWWLHEVTFLKTDDDGRPLISLGTLTDITALKKDDTLNLYIGKYEDGINYTVKITKKYPLLRDIVKLSRREIEILKMISDGYLSKQIADKLHISFHTVNTHRQHMLEKTNTLTTSELVSYALERGVI